MNYFCTLFDSHYMSRGLVMYDSLIESGIDFHLYIFAFDDLTLNTLKKINPDRTTIIALKEFENENLLAVKGTRTKTEYFWTCASSIIDYVLNRYNVTSCTYIDADLFFYKSPEILLNELPDNKSVLITEHRYSKIARIFEGRRAGKFCVQFIMFLNNREAWDILKKWIDQCITWCYANYEDGKFGDQKYLDSWPDEYPAVHILRNIGGGVAPWNILRYKIIDMKAGITFSESSTKTNFELIFYHFHHIKIYKNGLADLGWNRLRKNVITILYVPYFERILRKEKYLEELMKEYSRHCFKFEITGAKSFIKYIFKMIFKFNIIRLPEI